MTAVGIMRLLAMISGLAFAVLLNWPVEGTRYGATRRLQGGPMTRYKVERLAKETKEVGLALRSRPRREDPDRPPPFADVEAWL